MEVAVTIGLDLGKSVFQVHGVNREGVVVVQRRLTRARLLRFFAKQPACLVGMEACAAAHHWAESFRSWYRPKLMPAFDPQQTAQKWLSWWFLLSVSVVSAAVTALEGLENSQILKLFPQVHRTIASDLVCGAEPSSQNGPSPLIANFTGR
jgi:hypothetical protein